jgi:hypothetical protein
MRQDSLYKALNRPYMGHNKVFMLNWLARHNHTIPTSYPIRQVKAIYCRYVVERPSTVFTIDGDGIQ